MIRSSMRRIAAQYLYSSGPKSGAVSKVKPTIRNVQGIQPGELGARYSAEEMNYILADLSDISHAAKLRPFFEWRQAEAESDGLEGVLALDRLGVFGFFTGWGPRLITSAGDYLANISIASDKELLTGVSKYIDAAGELVVVFFLTDTSLGAPYVPYVCKYSQSAGVVQGTQAVADGSAGVGAGVADVGTHIIGIFPSPLFLYNARCVRVNKSTGAVSSATTHPAGVIGLANSSKVAGGGGVGVIAGASSAGESPNSAFAVSRSTDGGDTWTTATIFSADVLWKTPVVLALSYVEDFRGLGPKFVCVWERVRSDDSYRHIMLGYSTDGTSWQWHVIAALDGTDPPEDELPSGGQGFIVGEYFVYFKDGAMYLWDLNTLKKCGHKITGITTTKALFDGERFWLYGGSPESYWISGAVTPRPSYTLTHFGET